MTDQRRTPANTRVAARQLRGKIEAAAFVDGTPAQIGVPLAELLRAPNGARDRQLLLGERVLVYEKHAGWAFVQALRDGYVGYILSDELVERPVNTHRVATRATHVYPGPDFKLAERMSLSFGAELLVERVADSRFSETTVGFVPTAHLRPIDDPETDPVTIAERLLGTPYLWGGNSSFGVDCSGLVQMACLACGMACPGDADMQEAELGYHLKDDAALRRGDLLFWKGHVAWVCDADTLIHANAFSMAVTFEPLLEALERIETQGDGPVTSRKRLGDPT